MWKGKNSIDQNADKRCGMIARKKWSQYGESGMVVKGLTIHNTNSTMSAQEIFDYLNNECTTSQGCHFVVDSENTIQVMPKNWCVYHTGKGKDYAFAHTLAIEICSNINDETYLLGQHNAVLLIRELMEQYNLDYSQIYFHQEFNERYYCPKDILDRYKTKANFIELLKEED